MITEEIPATIIPEINRVTEKILKSKVIGVKDGLNVKKFLKQKGIIIFSTAKYQRDSSNFRK